MIRKYFLADNLSEFVMKRLQIVLSVATRNRRWYALLVCWGINLQKCLSKLQSQIRNRPWMLKRCNWHTPNIIAEVKFKFPFAHVPASGSHHCPVEHPARKVRAPCRTCLCDFGRIRLSNSNIATTVTCRYATYLPFLLIKYSAW